MTFPKERSLKNVLQKIFTTGKKRYWHPSLSQKTVKQAEGP
jgi:hypothetical protein